MTGLNGTATTYKPLIPFGTTSFVVVERTVRLIADDPQFGGFEVDVRSNLAGFERERLIAGLDEIDEAQAAIVARSEADAKRIDDEYAAAVDANRAAAELARRAATDRMITQISRDIEATRVHRLPLIAPYIHAWNAYEPDGQGGYTEIPPPRVGGVDVFDRITPPMVQWLVSAVLQGYRSGKGLTQASLPTSGELLPLGSASVIGGPKVNPLSTPASRRKSSTRSA